MADKAAIAVPNKKTLASSGSYALFVRSGLKPIEFKKAAIAVQSLDKLPSVIDTLITAVRNGELDQQFADASAQTKSIEVKREACGVMEVMGSGCRGQSAHCRNSD